MKRLTFVALLLLAASSAHADSLTVTDMAFGTGIENHAITGVDNAFTVDVGRVYCWTVTVGAGEGDTIFHTWILGDHAVQRVPLRVEGARYRTYTFKTMSKAMVGTWTVEVTDRNGTMLAKDSVVVAGAITDET
jgi:hypothetical protein